MKKIKLLRKNLNYCSNKWAKETSKREIPLILTASRKYKQKPIQSPQYPNLSNSLAKSTNVLWKFMRQ